MVVHFDYNIGDKVRLIKEVDVQNIHFYEDRVKFESCKDRIYEITMYGIDLKDGKEPFIYYRLYDSERLSKGYLCYHNRLTSEYLEPVGEVHPFDEDVRFMSRDKKEINLNDYVYGHLYNSMRNDDVNIRFTFTGYGIVRKLSYYLEKDRTKPCFEVTYKREFLCVNNKGVAYGDARRYGAESYDYAGNISFGADEKYIKNFAEQYVKCKKYLTDYDEYDIKEYLTHLGVYDQVFELIKVIGKEEKKEKKAPKKSTHGSKKLKKLLSGLNEEELKELKKLL